MIRLLKNDIFYNRSRDEHFRTKQDNYGVLLAFSVNEFFSFGSPLSLILAYRRMLSDSGNQPFLRPS